MPQQLGRGYPGLRRSAGTFRGLIFILPNPPGRSGVPNVKPRPTVPRFGNLPYMLGSLAAELTNEVMRRYLSGDGSRDWSGAGWVWNANVNYPQAGFTTRITPHHTASGHIGSASVVFNPFPNPHVTDPQAVMPTDIVTIWDSVTNPTLDSFGWHAKDPQGTWAHPGGVQANAPGENVTVIDLPMPRDEASADREREKEAQDAPAKEPYRDSDVPGDSAPYPGAEFGRPDVGPDWPQYNPEQLPIGQPVGLPFNPPASFPQPLPDIGPLPLPDIRPVPGEPPLEEVTPPPPRPQPRWRDEAQADPWLRYLRRANERARARERQRPREQEGVQLRVGVSAQRVRQRGERRRTVTRKMVADYGIVGRVFGTLTEVSDAVDALWDALPEWAKTRAPFRIGSGYRAGGIGSTKPSARQKVVDVYNFLQGNPVQGWERTVSGEWIESVWRPGEADFQAWQTDAINNLLKNEAQDQVIGRANKALARAFGRRTGRFVSPGFGPAM